jgi:hypothetical protein
MTYEIIKTLSLAEFRKFSKKDCQAYKEWFFEIMPKRIEGLISAVHATPGFEHWNADYSPNSLDVLGEWFAQVAANREKSKEELEVAKYDVAAFQLSVTKKTWTQEELETTKQQLEFLNFVGYESWLKPVLTERTKSIAFDVGLYLSQVFLKQYPQLTWSQNTTAKKDANYGQPVLMGFGKVPCNCMWKMEVLAYSLADKSKTGKRLRELYHILEETISLA